MRRNGLTRTAGIIAMTLIIAAVFIYIVLQPAIGYPDESRRIVHPSGFSIVVPIGWESTIRQVGLNGSTADSIRCLPIKVIGFGGAFSFSRLPLNPKRSDLETKGYKLTTFHGHEAWESFNEHKKTKEHTRDLLFEEAGNWYELIVTQPGPDAITGKPWQPYFDSARASPVTAKPTSQPGN